MTKAERAPRESEQRQRIREEGEEERNIQKEKYSDSITEKNEKKNGNKFISIGFYCRGNEQKVRNTANDTLMRQFHSLR